MPSTKFIFSPPVIAHRGASAIAPENTASSFQRAALLGMKWVEFDVMLTSDGHAVVIHDETLDRTSDGTGRVCERTFDYIKTLDAGSWFGAEFSSEKILMLQELIVLLHQLDLSANIEIKAIPGMEETTARCVMKILEAYWSPEKNPPLISSFSRDILREVRRISPEAAIGFLMDHWEESWKEDCDALQAVAVDVNHLVLTPDRVKEIKATDRYVLAYTVNDPVRMRELLSWGVDAVFSDCG